MDALIEKLMISKKIMDKHNGISRNTDPSLSQPVLENFEPVNAKYNIPQEILQESIPTKNYNNETPTEDRIINSKLPEEIKRLMLEYPINQPNSMNGSSVISNELVEKATRLMNVDASGKQTQQTNQTPTNQNIVIENKTQNSLLNDNNLRDILKEVVEEVLSENGLLVESERKSNEVFKFRVGQHIFEGKLTKIKKIS